jgi:hypothetical protein
MWFCHNTEHPVADRDTRDSVTELLDDADEIATKDKRISVFKVPGHVACSDREIETVDRRRRDAYKHLARPRFRNVKFVMRWQNTRIGDSKSPHNPHSTAAPV